MSERRRRSERIDEIDVNRSLFLEQAALLYPETTEKNARDAKDAAILCQVAEQLNQEAADVLEYQDFQD